MTPELRIGGWESQMGEWKMNDTEGILLTFSMGKIDMLWNRNTTNHFIN